MGQEAGKTGSFGDCSEVIIGACIEVHRQLGPGLLESAYEECVAYELCARGLFVERQRAVPLVYKDVRLECGYRVDLIVERSLIVEIKTVDRLMPIHVAQVLTYLRLTNLPTGILVNFRESLISRGLRRLTLTKNFPSSRLPVNSS